MLARIASYYLFDFLMRCGVESRWFSIVLDQNCAIVFYLNYHERISFYVAWIFVAIPMAALRPAYMEEEDHR